MCRAGLVLLDFIFGSRVSSGHPSHCRPSLVLIELFLLLSPLQVVTHLSSDLSWYFWTSCSAIPFPAVTHPTADRARCCLTFFFDCLLFRWSPIQVPTQTGAGGLYFRCPVFGGHPSQCRPSPALLDIFLRLPPLPVVTHPSADPARCCWTSSSAIPFHPLRIEPGAA